MREFLNGTELETWLANADTETKINFLVRQAAQSERYCLSCKLELKEADAQSLKKLQKHEDQIKKLQGGDQVFKRNSALLGGGAAAVLTALVEFIKWLWPK